jgi:hypothetical protein
MPKTIWTDRGACPAFFRACCKEAAHGRYGGYQHAGWHLALHTDGQVSEDADVDALVEAAEAEDLDAIVAWYAEWLPRCIRLVPKRRRRQFARGVVQLHSDRGLV